MTKKGKKKLIKTQIWLSKRKQSIRFIIKFATFIMHKDKCIWERNEDQWAIASFIDDWFSTTVHYIKEIKGVWYTTVQRKAGKQSRGGICQLAYLARFYSNGKICKNISLKSAHGSEWRIEASRDHSLIIGIQGISLGSNFSSLTRRVLVTGAKGSSRILGLRFLRLVVGRQSKCLTIVLTFQQIEFQYCSQSFFS